MMFSVVLDAGRHRELFLLHLEKNGIETRYLFPLLDQPVYQALFPDMAKEYPVAQHLSRHGFFIGMHQAMTLEDMDYISDVIHEYFVR
jgi:dTDP-4-amino-4,6-dideoxygalactose transaminase